MDAVSSKFPRKSRMRCPWLWLSGLIFVLLAVSWIRERQRIRAAAATPFNVSNAAEFVEEAMRPDFSPDIFMRRALLTQFGTPTLMDPFGNFIYFRSKFLGSDPLKGVSPPPALGVSIIVFNRDGSPSRAVSLDSDSGFDHLEYKAEDGDILPALTAAVLLLLTVLWLRWEWRNRKRARSTEMEESRVSGYGETGQ